MSVRRKRVLLAGIEGQLAAMKGDELTQRRWHRIGRALDDLGGIPGDDFETARLEKLRRQIDAMLTMSGEYGAWILAQQRTLARADCIIWQMYLRRHDKAPVSTGMQWPPRVWSGSRDDDMRYPDRAVSVAI